MLFSVNVKDTNKPTLLMWEEAHTSITEVNDHVSDHTITWKILAITRESAQGAIIKLLLENSHFLYMGHRCLQLGLFSSSREDTA